MQVFSEQSWPLDAFCAAVQIMDKFLDVCCHILRSQLQVDRTLRPLKRPLLPFNGPLNS